MEFVIGKLFMNKIGANIFSQKVHMTIFSRLHETEQTRVFVINNRLLIDLGYIIIEPKLQLLHKNGRMERVMSMCH